MRQISRKSRLELKKNNKTFPNHLIEIEVSEEKQANNPNLLKVFRSRYYLVQVFEDGDVIRLSINKTEVNNDGSWKENIGWEDLQQLKRQAGFANHYAVEVYPRDVDLVNVANMRHIWVLENPLKIGWSKSVEQLIKD